MNRVDMTFRRFLSFDENLSSQISRFTITWPRIRRDSADNVSGKRRTNIGGGRVVILLSRWMTMAIIICTFLVSFAHMILI